MKQPDPKIFDDIARMAGGAMNVFSGLREQITADIKARVEEVADRMDLVPRDDFDRLAMQVADLQKKLDALTGTKKTTAPKAATKPKTSTKQTVKKPGKKK